LVLGIEYLCVCVGGRGVKFRSSKQGPEIHWVKHELRVFENRVLWKIIGP